EHYRGEVVHYAGRLTRVLPLNAPKFIRGDIPVIYECWLFDLKVYGANPFCALVTELPPGISVEKKIDIPVTFDGYFFKRYRYKAGDGWRDAPLLIGRTLRVEAGAKLAPEDDVNLSFSKDLVAACIALFGITIGLMIALAWWYRRGDQR